MHIADGIIATELCVAADVASLGALYLFSRKTEAEAIPRMGFMGAALFVASLIHFPIAGTSVHLSLIGLAGVILGLRAFPVILVVLLFQSLLFQHGGLISLGLNAANIGAGAAAAWLIWRGMALPVRFKAILAGAVGVLVPAFLMALEFQLSGYGRSFFYIMYVYSAVALVEALLTMTVVEFFARVQPDLLRGVVG